MACTLHGVVVSPQIKLADIHPPLPTGLESLIGFKKEKKKKSANKIKPNHAGSSTSQHFPLHRIKKDTPRCWDRHSFYGLLLLVLLGCTLKPKRFNSFYGSTCIPDNQTGSWPWGPWRSCRAVPHTHGCSGGKPHGGLQS